MARKCVAMSTIDIVQLIVNQSQRKQEIAAMLVFVGTGHWNFQQMTKWLRSGLTQNILYYVVQFKI